MYRVVNNNCSCLALSVFVCYCLVVMPRVQTIPDHLRFFARIDKFHMECPKCAGMIYSHTDSKRKTLGYNFLTGRVRCPYCRFIFALGIVAYPAIAHVRTGYQRPPDQKPTWGELLQLRGLLGGHYIAAAKRPDDHLNLYVETECRCQPDDRGYPCPIHRPAPPNE